MARRHITSNQALWAAQGLLAVVFLFAGGVKLAMSAGELADTSALPWQFMKFIGACEVLGGLALVLPGIARRRIELTPIAACGLVVIMVGATIDTVVEDGAAVAMLPLAVGMVAAAIAYGRGRQWLAVRLPEGATAPALGADVH